MVPAQEFARAGVDAQAPAVPAAGILLVEDHDLVRLGFRTLVQSQAEADRETLQRPRLQLHEAATLTDALAFYAQRGDEVSVVVLDLGLPDAEGLSGLLAFRQRFADALVVVLSGLYDHAVVRNALALGALAFFSKSGDLADLVNFVNDCALRGPQAALRRLPQAASGVAGPSGLAPVRKTQDMRTMQALTSRQLQVLQWLLDGKSNREIGTLACLSEGTVKNYVSMLLLSFAARSRAELISKLRS